MVARLRRAIALLLTVVTLSLASCGGDRAVPVVLLEEDAPTAATNPLAGVVAEVSPPERIQQLKPYLDVYAPQVRILAPRQDETLQSTAVAVELQVRDFAIYKDPTLALGPHLHLFLDDQPYQDVYTLGDPIRFTDLAPGTHTLRVVAARPWGESFKNEGAYDQVTFNIFTASPGNHPDDSQALLTFNQPQGRYGTEPILLDFYLKNAPLHEVAQADEAIADWRIRCTVNGESFVFDRWQPIYLKGFQPGTNWVKLEIIDENGNLIDNTFNSSIHLVDYTPGQNDSLTQLIRGDIPLAQAKVLVDPNYEYVPPVSTPVPPAEPPTAPPAAIAPTSDQPAEDVTPKTDDATDGATDTEPLDAAPLEAPPSTPAPAQSDRPEPEVFPAPALTPEAPEATAVPDEPDEPQPVVPAIPETPDAVGVPPVNDGTPPSRQRSRFSRERLQPERPVTPPPATVPSATEPDTPTPEPEPESAIDPEETVEEATEPSSDALPADSAPDDPAVDSAEAAEAAEPALETLAAEADVI